MITLIRGFRDILPGEVEVWQYVENCAKTLFEDFGFREIRIPIMERTELFARSIGADTDIVEKEMYTFPDRKGDLITLRPEATAAVCRSYIQHKMYAGDPVQRFYTIGPMFRRERPQKGRYRQFYQINAEIFGIASPLADVELIVVLITLLRRLAVQDVAAHINSLGCPACRPDYTRALSAFLKTVRDELCQNCVRRSERNPLRTLDCKVPQCREVMQGAPILLDYLCEDCREDFATVQSMLKQLDIEYVIDKNLVRGLDYYTRTTFEIQTGALGAQSAIAGGGRYDGLIKALGGPDQAATGFAIGLDRLAEIVGSTPDLDVDRPDLYIAALGPQSIAQAFKWTCELCRRGVRTTMDFNDRSLKSQMKRADKLGAANVLIVGDQELVEAKVTLRNMQTKRQTEFALDQLIKGITDMINRNA
jgi:histidyl-tRNA synthetase